MKEYSPHSVTIMDDTGSTRPRICDGVIDDKPPILSLPSDLLEEIIAKAASKSSIDLVNIKLSCKDFLHASEANNVWKNVSLEDFPSGWYPHQTAIDFLQHCREKGNIGILYRDGVKEFCNYLVANVSGHEKLKYAAECDLKQAKYLYEIILFCSDDNETRQEGMQHLRDLVTNKCFLETKRSVFNFLGNF